MAGKTIVKSPNSRWCLFRDSDMVKTAILVKLKEQKEKHGKSMFRVCKEANVDLTRVSRYLHGVKPSVSQYMLMKLCRHLGISVEADVSFFEI